MRTMEELLEFGTMAEASTKESKLGVKQRPWWPFIPLTNYVSPLLHCEIGIGNVLFELLRDVINEHIEHYLPREQFICDSIPSLQQVIANTTTQRDQWDNSENGNSLKIVKRAVIAYQKHYELVAQYDGITTDEEVRTHETNVANLKKLQDSCNGIAEKLKRAHNKLVEQQTKLKDMRRAKVRGQQSIETKIFRVLKQIGIKLRSYHGGSLNGKDIKHVMNNATHLFDEFAAIFKEGKREGYLLSDDNIDACVCILRRCSFCATAHLR